MTGYVGHDDAVIHAQREADKTRLPQVVHFVRDVDPSGRSKAERDAVVGGLWVVTPLYNEPSPGDEVVHPSK